MPICTWKRAKAIVCFLILYRRFAVSKPMVKHHILKLQEFLANSLGTLREKYNTKQYKIKIRPVDETPLLLQIKLTSWILSYEVAIFSLFAKSEYTIFPLIFFWLN